MKKIKVVIAENDLIVGGVQRLAIDQLRLLDRELFEPYLITLIQFPGKADFYDLVPEDVTVVKCHFNGFYDLRSWIRLVKTMWTIKPDLVKSSLFFSNTVFRAIKLVCGYTIITAEHNTGTPKRFFQRLIDRLLAPLSSTIVTDSKMVSDFIAQTEKINPAKFTVIYNGVDIDAIARAKTLYQLERNHVRQQLAISLDGKVFLSIARTVKQKNHRLMIEAFTRLNQSRSDCFLVIIGDGSLKQEVDDQVQALGLKDKVLVMGERKDIDRFYVASDFFLLTSRHEGFCISAMQGLGFGLPLISTRVAGVLEYLCDGVNGLFADQTADDIAAKMNQLASLSTTELADWRQAATATAERYSTVRYGQAYRDLFLRCLKLTDPETRLD